VPNFGRFRGIERLEVFGFGGLSHDNFAVGDLCLDVIDSLVVVEQSLWSGSLREVRLLQLAKMVVKLLPRKFLGRVVIIGYVFSHSTETGLRHAAVTDLRLASLDIPRGNHNFSILVPEVFLDLLVISKMVEGGIVRQTNILCRPEGSVVFSSFREQFTVPHHILS